MLTLTNTNQLFGRHIILTVSLLLILLASGCANLPANYPRTVSTAIQDYQSTPIGKKFLTDEVKHPGKSGFSLIRFGRSAFNTRIAMIDMASKTIDLQVYIWEPDMTGRILTDRLIEAANRGVRIRLLVDDMGLSASDENIAAMDAHPNIEIRIFNPFATRKAKMLSFIIDMNRVNHRMHNKIMITDNSLAIVGGRNIGDHYFSVDPKTNFRDLDLAAVGPIVRDTSDVFDHFWNGEWSLPIAVLAGRAYTEDEFQTLFASLQKRISASDYPYSIDDDLAITLKIFTQMQDAMIWAPGKVVWDDPVSIVKTGETSEMRAEIQKKVDNVQGTLTIESAYFVIGDGGVARVKSLIDKGVSVRVLTNSLVSNDVLAAHAGHASYRKQLLEAGAEVFELRADSGIIQKTWKGESRAGLHTKALVFDNESLLIGSFNLDPRSANINTEVGLYVESSELAEQLVAYMDEGVKPENSYQLMLDEGGDLVWITDHDGLETRYDKDPLSSLSQRIMSGFIRLLPIESQL